MRTAFEADHVFVAVEPGADSVVARLEDAGFLEGPANVHPGQGTACRRVFFENAYLELIWLAGHAQATSPAIRRTGLAARVGGDDGASRLGVAMRAGDGGSFEPPIPTWPYRPPYLPDGLAIPMADSSTVLAEPLLFFMPWERQWSAPALPHPNGARRVTAVSVMTPAAEAPTPALRWLEGGDRVRVEVGPAERLEIELDGGTRGRSLELAPAASLTLRW